MATIHYNFYAVEIDPLKPTKVRLRVYNGAGQANTAVLSKHSLFMSANKGTAQEVAARMSKLRGARR